MGRFRKKLVVISAVQFNGIEQVDGCSTPMFDLGFDPPSWIVDGLAKAETESGAIYPNGDDLVIVTLEGDHRATSGDWIIQGVKGELYPCKPDIFAATYDPA